MAGKIKKVAILEEYVEFGSILPNVKDKIGRKMIKPIESEPLDGFCLQSEQSAVR